jgi:hypothetical protein
LPNERVPTSVARLWSLRAPATISAAEAEPPLISTIIGLPLAKSPFRALKWSVSIVLRPRVETISPSSTHGEILAPPQLEGVKGAKAVYVRGRAMEPRYYAGEVIYLNPNRSPNPGDFIFITVKEPSFPASVGYVRRLVGSDLVSIRVSTLNPKRELLIPRQEVIAIATVVGSGVAYICDII